MIKSMNLTPRMGWRTRLGGLNRTSQVEIKRSIEEAGKRYERLAHDDKAMGTGTRRRVLKTISVNARSLCSDLAKLDAVSREDFANRFGDEELEKLMGHLARLETHANELFDSAQPSGPQRDLATERWIADLRYIYERRLNFRATVWGGVANPGPFFQFLEDNRPRGSRQPRLEQSHVRRVLKRKPSAGDTERRERERGENRMRG
jgi:hypothetical protein